MKKLIVLTIGICFSLLLNAQVSKTINVTAGSLNADLTPSELSSITNLTLNGTIDARDFKTMRDDMPLLAVINMSNATVVAYTGTEGTESTNSTAYAANEIPWDAFNYKISLTSCILPPSIISFGYYAFGNCGLTSITIPSSVSLIRQYAFESCYSLTSVTIPPSITSIEDRTFAGCRNLTSVTIPSSINSIGREAFFYCTGLTSVTIPSSVILIGENAFVGCNCLFTVDALNPSYSSKDGVLFNKTQTLLILYPSLKTGIYIIPSSVVSIGNNVFVGCYNLTSVTIPSSVNSIGTYAFNGCSGLISIYAQGIIPVNLNSSFGVFYNVNKTTCTLYVPCGTMELYANADQWKDFTNIVELPPANAGTISGSSTVCQGQNSVNYTIQAITNATSYIWALLPNATGSSTTNNITVNYGKSAVSGNISVKGHNDCGDGIESTLAITVNPLPANAGTISGLATVCQGQNSVNYTIPAINNATSYIWILPPSATGSSTTNSITVNYGKSAVSGNISVKGHNDCGDGIESTLAITVNPLPANAGTISGSSTVCQGQNSVNYTIPAINNATSYIWALPPNATDSSTTNSITVNYGKSAVSGNISVKGHNNCGDGIESTLAITVNPLPANAGTISGSSTVCQGQNSVNYTIQAITNATSIIWALPPNATGSSTTNNITVNYGKSAVSGNISVKGHNDCGDGIESTLAITVNPLPANAGIISGSSTVCQGQNSVNYTIPAINDARSYMWALPTDAKGSSTTNSITVNYGKSAVSGNISVMGRNDCGDGIESTLAITVNPLPANAGIISGSTTVCQGQNSVNYTIPAIANATSYIWILPNSATGTSITNSIKINYNTSAVSGNISVKGKNDCGEGTATTLTIIVNPANNITEKKSICSGQNYQGWTTSGTYQRKLQSKTGCDSIVTTVLTVNPDYNLTENIPICQGQNYNGWTTTGKYARTLKSKSGCDSVVVTNLTINPVHNISENKIICQGQSYHGWTKSGTYQRKLQSEYACDSIVTTILKVNPSYNIKENTYICQGESYNGWTSTGTYNRIFQSRSGCDSIVSTDLTVFPSYNPIIIAHGDTLQAIRQYKTYQWYNESGVIAVEITEKYVVRKSGKYHMVITDENGCTNNSEVFNAIFSDLSARKIIDFRYSITPNPNIGHFTFRIDSDPPSDLLLKLINPVGQIIENRVVKYSRIDHAEQFNVSHLSKGIYLLIILSDKKFASEKIVIQ